MEEVANLSPDKETNVTNLDNLEAVSRNEQATSSRDAFEAGFVFRGADRGVAIIALQSNCFMNTVPILKLLNFPE